MRKACINLNWTAKNAELRAGDQGSGKWLYQMQLEDLLSDHWPGPEKWQQALDTCLGKAEELRYEVSRIRGKSLTDPAWHESRKRPRDSKSSSKPTGDRPVPSRRVPQLDLKRLRGALEAIARDPRTQQALQLPHYLSLATRIGLSMETDDDRNYFFRLLDEISRQEHSAGAPLLSVLVTREDSHMPGPGFFRLAVNVGRLARGTSEEGQLEFFSQELRSVYAHWSSEPQGPGSLGQHRPGGDVKATGSRRVGHYRFKRAVERHWEGRCAITGGTQLLRAAHIRPWAQCEPDQKTDPDNGLLLSPTLDAAFDAFLLSFEEDGSIVFANHFNPDPALHLDGDMCVTPLAKLTAGHREYLRWHREEMARLSGLVSP
ncbi:HNH endonuclease [Microbulbifer litoralis]|uniref:HNH endonuclease n=1 Tax=Microbulbifer litoralis TaxID=2933965 RepID=UPI003CE58FA4